ncbi:hypothetical protein D3C72_992840 [compost metagenome]
MRSDRRPKKGMKKHMTSAAAITPVSASVRVICTVCVRYEMENTPNTLKNTPSIYRAPMPLKTLPG